MSKCLLSAAVIAAISSVNALAAEDNQKGFYIGVGAAQLSIKEEDGGFKLPNFSDGSIQFGYKLSDNFSIEGQHLFSAGSKSVELAAKSMDVTSDLKMAMALGGLTATQRSYVNSTVLTATAKAVIDLESTAIFAVYRTSGDLYGKVKLGAASINGRATLKANIAWKNDLSPNTTSTVKDYISSFENAVDSAFYKRVSNSAGLAISERDTKLAAGIGAGYTFLNSFNAELEYTKLASNIGSTSLTINYNF